MTSSTLPIGGPADLRQIDIAPPGDGEITRLADDLVWYRFRMPFRLNHINLFALETEAGWILVDCGINTDDTSAQWDAILPQLTAKRPIAGILVTHHHGDHIGHAGPLAARTGAPILMGQAEYDMARAALAMSHEGYGEMAAAAYANYGLPGEVVERNRRTGNYYRQLVAPLPEVTIIDQSWRLRTIAGEWSPRFDAGHSPGHVGLSDPDRQLYLAIDFLLGRISPNISVSLRDPDGDVLASYFDYLKHLHWLTPDWRIFCGHDWHYFDGARRARQLIAHHDRRLDQLRGAPAPLTTDDAIRTLFPMELTDHEIYFASCEARAHLNHLVTRGEMAREMAGGVARFTPV
ncbi:MAG: MBL fold metallo-hydrolase [Candidatus Puniceispirillaceae bacterium]